jgi:tRNA uracil 4-sulfurtransferase
MFDCTHIVLHYDEIGLKSSNRAWFERLLAHNVRRKCGEDVASVSREIGQLTVRLAEPAAAGRVLDALGRVPGIAHFSPAVETPRDLDAIRAKACELLAPLSFVTFKIHTRRHDKKFRLTSMDVNRDVGAAVLERMPDRKVRMERPDVTLQVELTAHSAFLSAVTLDGVGGLPTNRTQKVVALLSGGLDSPVAAYLLMKRGCEVVLAHFQNANQLTDAVEDKVVQLATQLSRYQVRTRLYVVPFEGLQHAIVESVPPPLRMLVYRRVMLRLAAQVAAWRRARMLVVGDSLSQVASQTYHNLHATYMGAPLPVLTPLIGLDKREITALSRRIGTYEISALPYGDCCSYFIPRHPELRATPQLLDAQLAALDLATLEAEALAAVRLHDWG